MALNDTCLCGSFRCRAGGAVKGRSGAGFGQQCCDHDERCLRWHPGLRLLALRGSAIGCWSLIGLLFF